MNHRLKTLLLIALLSAGLPAARSQNSPQNSSQPRNLSPAQNTDGPSTPTPFFKTNARAVVVDVVVTKGDEPVSALRKLDFQVLEDGKPQTIDYFEEHTAKTLPPGALPPLPKMPPHVYTNVPSAPPSDDVNVLLLDSLNTEKQDQVFVRRQILQFVQGMQPGTRCAIFTLGSKLRFIQGFTSDSSALVAALNDKRTAPEKNPAHQSMSDKADDAADLAKLSVMLGGRSDGGLDAFRSALADHADFQASERTMMTLEALNYLARYLADVPGRKNLIWFASSFPVTVFPTPSQRQAMSEARVYASAVRRTADLLTVSNVAVYPIGAQGMMVEHTMEADAAGPGRMGDIGSYSGEAGERADTISAMEQLANDTGGKAFYNTNNLNGALQHAINDGSHYYTLVYSPTNKKMDGKYRKIEVKVPEYKYKLAYRRGYNADDSLAGGPNDPDPVRPLLMRGLPAATQILYGVRILPQNPQPKPNSSHAGKNPKLVCPCTRYDLDFMIRWTDIALPSSDDVHHHGRIEVGLMAYDRDGNPVNWSAVTQGMNLDPDVYKEIQKSGVPAHMEIDLPNAPVFLDTGIYDWNNGKAGTLEVPLNPPDGAAAAASSAAPKPN